MDPTINPAKFETCFEQFITGLRAKYPNTEAREQLQFEVEPGRRYIRIVRRSYSAGSAYAFVDTTNGDVLKPAGYKAPAKGARGNIFNPDFGLDCCGEYSVAYMSTNGKTMILK